jgi:hypothetical protein
MAAAIAAASSAILIVLFGDADISTTQALALMLLAVVLITWARVHDGRTRR